MPQRIAAISSIMVFIGCLLAGAIGAENSFVTAVERALGAMVATLVIGLVVGWMAQRMIQENVAGVVKTPGVTPATEVKETAKPQAAVAGAGKKNMN
jgi:hypothetical protein